MVHTRDNLNSRPAMRESEHRLSSAGTLSGQDPSRTNIVEWITFWGFIVGLAWIPYWYGSNVLVAWGINAVLFPGLALGYELSIMLRGKPHARGFQQLKVPAALFVAVMLWILIQNASWTPIAWHHPIWAMAADAVQKEVDGSISVNRDLTSLALLRLITAASVFWIALQLCQNALRATYLVRAIVWITS